MDLLKLEAHGLREYEETLSLQWPVSYFLRRGEDRCRITCDPDTRSHEMWLPEWAVNEPEGAFHDLLHELCHAKLAETVDVVFSTIYFVEELHGLSGEELDDFNRRGRMLFTPGPGSMCG